MAKMEISGNLDSFSEALNRLAANTDEIIKAAVYEGGGVVADRIKSELKTLPVEEGENGLSPVGTAEKKLKGVTRIQKGDLIDSMGTAPIQEFTPGSISTKVGWDGYGSVPTAKYPRGVPNQLLMRAVESGSSFRVKNPVVRRAVMASKGKALQKMEETVKKEIKEMIE